MRPALRLALPALVLLLLPLAAAAAPVPTERDEKLIALMEALDEKRKELNVPGLGIAIVSGDEVIHAEGLGLADVEGGRPADPRTVWAIGSSTKAFTAALAAMHVEKQRIEWDEPLHWYLPEFRVTPDSEDEKAAVTFRDALSHRSGFARMGPLWAAGLATPEQMYLTASNAEPVAPFRESFNYNNVFYTAAGDALARAAGRPYDVLVRKRLFKPLGMRNASLSIDDAAKDDNLAKGYAWDEDAGKYLELPMRSLDLVAPAGAINATVLDVAQWVRFQLAGGVIDGKRLLAEELVHETWTPQISMGGESGYGLGWMVHPERAGRRVVEHGGNIDGFAAQVTLYPDDDLGYVLLMNTTASPLQQLSVGLVADHLLASEEEAAAAADAGDMTQLTGDYLANFGPFQNQTFAVSVVNEKLHVNVPGQMNFELKPPGEDGRWVFAMTDAIAVSFDRNDEGQAVAMKMYQNGLTFELPREGFEKPAAAFPEEWRRYLGKFRSPSLQQDITVLDQDGKLAVDVPGQMVFALKPPADGRWSFEVSDTLQVEFASDAAGNVESVTQYRNGQAVETWPRVAGGGNEPAGDIDAVLALVKADERGRALKALGQVRMTGSVRLLSSGITGRVETVSHGPRAYSQLMDNSPFMRIFTRVDGEEIVVESNVNNGTPLTEQQRRQMRVAHPLALFSDWRLYFGDISYDSTGEIDGRATHRVKLQAEGLEPMTVHVDAETGDVLRVEAFEPLGRGLPDIAVETVFSDHREVGGLRLPGTIRSSTEPGGTTVLSFETMEVVAAATN